MTPRERDMSVAEVSMRTDRDDTGIDYLVVVKTREDVYDGCENEYLAWQLRVDFGANDATCAGGYAFVRAARRQLEIAEDVWARTAAAGVPWSEEYMGWTVGP